MATGTIIEPKGMIEIEEIATNGIETTKIEIELVIEITGTEIIMWIEDVIIEIVETDMMIEIIKIGKKEKGTTKDQIDTIG